MSDETPTPPVDERLVARRAELLPEEKEGGSEDAEAQARAILEDSETRAADRDAAPGSFVESRRSEETVEPQD
ncbi:MAG: hypothetical protein GEV08_01735 [Acidimicrobiia bacterium]|nr:hypothetical protein [Acidimicrobiia bacterium]